MKDKYKFNFINWFYKDELTDKNEVYILPTIIFIKSNRYSYIKTYYIHFVWLKFVRNIEFIFTLKH